MTRDKDLVILSEDQMSLLTVVTDDFKCIYSGKQYKKSDCIPFSEALKIIEKTENERLVKPWKKTTKEHFWEMLEVLPPLKWGQYNNVEMFAMSEFLTSDLTSHYAKYKNKYYVALRRIGVPAAKLSLELIEQLEPTIVLKEV